MKFLILCSLLVVASAMAMPGERASGDLLQQYQGPMMCTNAYCFVSPCVTKQCPEGTTCRRICSCGSKCE